MKKLSSMLALSMALALTFGMTVSAAGSPNTATGDTNLRPTDEEVLTAAEKTQELGAMLEEEGAGVVILDANGDEMQLEGEVTVTPVEAATVAQIDKMNAAKAEEAPDVKNVIKNIDFLKDYCDEEIPDDLSNTKVTVELGETVAAAEITLPAGLEEEALENGITLKIELPSFVKDESANYVIMHLTGGKWEFIEPDAVEDGYVTATFTSLSPMLLQTDLKVTVTTIKEVKPEEKPETKPETTKPTGTVTPAGDDGEWLEPRHPENQPAAQAAANPATSPRTAETLPAAGVMAMICLAGAAVCAGRIRYNK